MWPCCGHCRHGVHARRDGHFHACKWCQHPDPGPVSRYTALRAEFLQLLVLSEPELSDVMRQFDRAVANLEEVPHGVDR
jgi:hypothetical protein